ncbi:MAG: SRPBCC family protein [Pseudonocardiaceae bacterium]
MYQVVRRRHVDVQVRTLADAATVYALLRDGATWPTWSPIESFQLERVGEPEPEGLGAIRIFRKGRMIGRDEIAGLVPDRRFSYRHLTGLPVRDYRGDVDLESSAAVTIIRWHISFTPVMPGTGWLLRWQIARFVQQCAQGLAVHAQTSQAPK